MTEPSESSPLLESFSNLAPHEDSQATKSFPLLLEIISARNLPVTNAETYCVVQYGLHTIHRTKPFKPKRTSRISRALRLFGGGATPSQDSCRDPIWTVQDDCLFTVVASAKDILTNNKWVTITIWSREKSRLRTNVTFVGRIKVKILTLLEECCNTLQERREMPLTNEVEQAITDMRGEPARIAYRCRLASAADSKFVEYWKQSPRPKQWSDTGIIPEPLLPRAKVITELPESKILALTPKMTARAPPAGYIRIKPYPDPNATTENPEYVTPESLYTQTILPSRNWIQVGTKALSIGRVEVEVLSAHGLPNVDIGGKIGNETDAFCSIVYGDAMAQTDVIFDELNPHWPSWSQRAFVFYMQHPSQVLYLAVFGFKRSPLNHRPIGRVEINPANFRNNVVYNLEYDLWGSSHAAKRIQRGRVRIRIRMEIENERKVLLAALRPPTPIFINTKHRKSMSVARYTVCGEYHNETRFSLPVLQGYVDELLQGYVRRIIYTIQDSYTSIVFWRSQITLLGVGVPLFSFLVFVMGMAVVEKPYTIPAVICFTVALSLLAQMHERLSSPSPWRRCRSFSYYFRILAFGHSGTDHNKYTIAAHEGAEELKEQEDELRRRIERDKDFIEKKEAVERQIEEIESVKVQHDSHPIPMELLQILGKVQSIVGDVCRFCRLCDAIVTWEESDVTFWITLGLLIVGAIFILLPWGWLLRWAGRIFVIVMFGPQNKILDLVWYQKIPTDEQKIYQIFASRMFEARCRQELTGKLKAFRQILFGKFATWVPPLFWSPHQDYPLPSSTAHYGKSNAQCNISELPLIPGQQLHDDLIPRPESWWQQNEEELATLREEALVMQQRAKETFQDQVEGSHNSPAKMMACSEIQQTQSEIDQGLEVMDLFDEEAAFVENVPSYHSTDSGKASFLRGRFTGSLHFDDDSSADKSTIVPASAEPVGIPVEKRHDRQSMIELGFEMPLDEGENAIAAFKTLKGHSAEETEITEKRTSANLAMTRIDQQSTTAFDFETELCQGVDKIASSETADQNDDPREREDKAREISATSSPETSHSKHQNNVSNLKSYAMDVDQARRDDAGDSFESLAMAGTNDEIIHDLLVVDADFASHDDEELGFEIIT